LHGYAKSKKARRNKLSAWMNEARDALEQSLVDFDHAVTKQGRPEPSYNILKATKAATSIRI
jgi:hypothetical protein